MFNLASATPPDKPSVWDGGAHTIRVVRRSDGTAFLIAIPCPHPWVYRRRWLTPVDVD
jgi:hypothetical protein